MLIEKSGGHTITQLDSFAVRPAGGKIYGLTPAEKFGTSTRQVLRELGFDEARAADPIVPHDHGLPRVLPRPLLPNLRRAPPVAADPPVRIGVYRERWWRWVCAGLPRDRVPVQQADHVARYAIETSISLRVSVSMPS